MDKLKLLILLIIFCCYSGAEASTKPDKPLQVSEYVKTFSPERIQKRTSINIYKNLEKNHIKALKINDQFSSNLLDKYIVSLDSSKTHFTAEDIKNFDANRFEFDNYLAKGNLYPAYQIFNLYQKRVVERLVFMVNNLNCCFSQFDFTLTDDFETDRENIPWPANASELDTLWKKRLKNDILNLKISEKKQDEILKTLTKRYRYQLKRAGQLKNEDVFRIYMNSLTSLFDPHTQYFSPRASEDFDIHMSLSLEGIGAVLQSEEDYTKVLRLVPAGPADKSELLKAGDRITGVGQGDKGEIVDVIGWRLDDVVQLIRGPKSTVVQLKIIPATAPDTTQTKTINITRNTVKLEEQAAQKDILEVGIGDKKFKIGVITIPTFYFDFNGFHTNKKDYKSTTKDVKRILRELKAEKIDGIVIDLRGNGGGALNEATDLTGLFIKKGPAVIVRDSGNRRDVQYDKDPEIYYEGPLAVLVNRMSASASEIFAGAIKDYKRGLILGTQTFGKGTVQTLIDLNQGKLKLTFAKFYRILGSSTQHKGIIPDISFPSVYNFDEVGESALDEALKWDTTFPERFKPYLNIDMEPLIAELTAAHEKRISSSAEYKYLVDFNNHYKELQKKTIVSLNEDTRKKELEESRRIVLGIENRLKKAKGEKPYNSYDEYKDEQEKKAEEIDESKTKKSDNDNDFILSESKLIFVDYINMLNSSYN